MAVMQTNRTRQDCARWIVIAIAACFAAVGCQSVSMRGQSDDLLPFPEAESPRGEDALRNESAPRSLSPPQRNDGAPSAKPAPPAAQSMPANAKPPTAAHTRMRVKIPPASVFNGPPIQGAPSELCLTTHATYVVEPPDVLLINAVKLVPKPPYLIEPFDILQIIVNGTLLGQDIAGQFAVDPSGLVDLGPAYGKVQVAGQSSEEATTTIEHFLKRVLRAPEVSVVIASTSGQQQVAGEHLIGLDGTINLGSYGSVYVAGMTIAEVKDAVEVHLSKFLQEPSVSVDVFTYQSKNYYIITQGAGNGDGITRVPITGKETVLDAIAMVNGPGRWTSKRMWIARPAPNGQGCDQILPVNYHEITAGAATRTNYQILPGDRVFIAEDKFVLAESMIVKITGPFERVLGFSLLGAQSIQAINRLPSGQPQSSGP
jgi:polysaccharide biosynthesis/export protein